METEFLENTTQIVPGFLVNSTKKRPHLYSKIVGTNFCFFKYVHERMQHSTYSVIYKTEIN